MCVGVSSSTCEPCVSLAQCVRLETWKQLQSKHENQGLVLEEVLEWVRIGQHRLKLIAEGDHLSLELNWPINHSA